MATSVNDESAPNVAKFHSKCSGPVTLRKWGDMGNVGKFHPKCGEGVKFDKDRRTASGDVASELCVALSNDPIPNTFKFSVKVLQKGSFVSPISAASIPHTLDAPYMAGGAVHVILCCLFFV